MRLVSYAAMGGLLAAAFFGSANAATVHPSQFELDLDRDTSSYDALTLSSDAVSLMHNSPYASLTTVDDVKRRAALKGFVALASIGFETKQSAPVQKSQRQAQAEAAIANLDTNLIMAIFVGLSAVLMWLGLSLHRETLDQ